MRIAINALCIRANKVLLLQKKETWILPGGKPEPGEDDLACLARENSEELPDSVFRIGELYGEYPGVTPHSHTELTARVYFGEVEGSITPNAEINEACFFSREEFDQLNVSEITKKILDSAVETGHLS